MRVAVRRDDLRGGVQDALSLHALDHRARQPGASPGQRLRRKRAKCDRSICVVQECGPWRDASPRLHTARDIVGVDPHQQVGQQLPRAVFAAAYVHAQCADDPPEQDPDGHVGRGDSVRASAQRELDLLSKVREQPVPLLRCGEHRLVHQEAERVRLPIGEPRQHGDGRSPGVARRTLRYRVSHLGADPLGQFAMSGKEALLLVLEQLVEGCARNTRSLGDVADLGLQVSIPPDDRNDRIQQSRALVLTAGSRRLRWHAPLPASILRGRLRPRIYIHHDEPVDRYPLPRRPIVRIASPRSLTINRPVPVSLTFNCICELQAHAQPCRSDQTDRGLAVAEHRMGHVGLLEA